jgi:predicted small secreted protein
MQRAFQVSFVILAAVLLAACSHLRAAKQRMEYRGFLEDWGVNSQKKPWVYAPLLLAVLLLSSCQTTTPRAPDPFDVMLGEAAAAMFRDTQMPNALK